MLRLPSISQLLKDNISPKKWRDIHNEHQIIKTTNNANELVNINRQILKSQLNYSSAIFESSNKISQELEFSTHQLVGIKDELKILNETVNEYGSASLKAQQQTQNSLNEGFSAIHQDLGIISNQIQQMCANQEKQNALFSKTLKILSKPYGIQQKELLTRANELLVHALKKSDRNQIKNLEGALKLFNEVVKNPIGENDYLAWFEIGFINWKANLDLTIAKNAFDQAQRLSDADNNADFYIKSLRYLALMHFIEKNYKEAYQLLLEAIEVNNRHAESLYELTIYSSLTGEFDKANDSLLGCLREDPLFFTRLLSDQDIVNLKNRNKLINNAVEDQRSRVRLNIDILSQLIKISTSYIAYQTDDTQKQISDLINTSKELIKTGKYVTLRKCEIELKETYIKLKVDNEVFLNNTVDENKSKIESIKGAKLKLKKDIQTQLNNIKNEKSKKINSVNNQYSNNSTHPDNIFDNTLDFLDGCSGCLFLIVLVIFVMLSSYVYNWFDFEEWWYSPIVTLIGLTIIFSGIVNIIKYLYKLNYESKERSLSDLRVHKTNEINRDFENKKSHIEDEFEKLNKEYSYKEVQFEEEIILYKEYLNQLMEV